MCDGIYYLTLTRANSAETNLLNLKRLSRSAQAFQMTWFTFQQARSHIQASSVTLQYEHFLTASVSLLLLVRLSFKTSEAHINTSRGRCKGSQQIFDFPPSSSSMIFRACVTSSSSRIIRCAVEMRSRWGAVTLKGSTASRITGCLVTLAVTVCEAPFLQLAFKSYYT